MGFTAAQKRTRDANRKSDLAQYRSALEAYANRNNGLYPVHATVVDADTICGASELNLTSCTLDSKDGTAPYGYKYISDGLKYLLYATLEAPSPATNVIFGLCSTGASFSIPSGTPTLAANCP